MMFKPMGICEKGTDLVEALKFYEAEKCPFNETKSMCDLNAYCQQDCDSCKLANDLRKKQDFGEALENLKQCLSECLDPLIHAISELAEILAEQVGVILPKVLSKATKIVSLYPNKKVLHLALHHPKEKVRKKNMTRIRKWLEKECDHIDL